MVIEESMAIRASRERVWEALIDLSCWNEWSTTVTDVEAEGSPHMKKGKRFAYCIRPFVFPINVKPRVEEVVPGRRVAWSARVYGVYALHEFFFDEAPGGVVLTSRETLKGGPVRMLLGALGEERLRHLARAMLKELKQWAEAGR
jgi:uncharacterized protein YndB with AHSA1/START domain